MNFVFFINIIAFLFSFFIVGVLLGAAFSKPFRKKLAETLHLHHLLALGKSSHNPILQPGTNPWTAEAVLNPAALVLGGRTHLVYRAIGSDGVSRLGYASSKNGIVFDERLPYPMYVERHPPKVPHHLRRYAPVLYPSGGSWGGAEDPRMVAIDGSVYVTFNLFENWTLRVGYIVLSEADFLAKRFYAWEGPYILSHGARDKNWVLFPEKIAGKFAVLHSIIGESDDRVRIEYTEDLKTLRERRFESPDPQKIPDQQLAWHVHVRSAGPPPIRTRAGWLLFYHANDASEPHKYKLGVMLLDLTDPSRVVCRSNAPVLTPDESYENHGKPGIVYACGAVVRHGTLFVYYGGADKVVCVATTSLDDFLDHLIKGAQPELDNVVPTQAP